MAGTHHQFPQTSLYNGSGTIEELHEVAQTVDATDALIVCGPTTGQTEEVIEPVRDALGDRYRGIYDSVESHVPIDNVERAITVADEHDTDLLVSVGGGSAHDTAKAISIMRAEGGNPHDYKVTRQDNELVAPELPASKTPIVAVPTTLSAAELNGAAAITDAETGEKMIVTDEKATPKAAIYDPELGIHTPTSIIAATGMNAIDHTVEMVYSRHHTPFTDATALRGLRMLREGLPKTIEEEENLKARETVLAGSALSGFGMEKGVCLNHAICHILGGKFGVPHGDANSIIMPHGMRFNLDATTDRQALLAEALGVSDSSRSEEYNARQAIQEIETLRDEIGAPAKLRETTVEKDDFEVIAAEAIQDLPITNNPKSVTEADIRDILEQAW